MKKVLAIVLCVAMLACFATTAFAADPATFTLTSDKEYVKAGETFVVTVGMPEGAMSTGNLYLEYDVDALTVNKISGIAKVGVGLNAAGAANVMNDDQVKGVMFAFAFQYPSFAYEDPNTDLFTVKFPVPADAVDGTEYEISFRAEDVTCAKSAEDPDTEPVEVTLPDPIKVIVGEKPVDPPVDGGDEPVDPPVDGGDEPTTDEPTTDEPTTDEPTTDKPAEDKPATDKPATSNPKTGDAGVAVFAGIVVAAAAAAFVASKKNA